jgi:hypothetical protein
MSDDWKPGDLALCVGEQDGDGPTFWEPVIGGTYHVAAVEIAETGLFLELQEDPYAFDPSWGWGAEIFRKINPLTDEERDEFIRELNIRKLTPYEAELAEMREVGL